MITIKSIILCAGYATRLYPLTKDTPKPLLSIAGKPMVEYILDKIFEIREIDEVFIVTNNVFHSKFINWLKDYNYGIDNKKFKKNINYKENIYLKNKNENIIIKIINDLTNSNETRLGAIGDIDFAIKKEKIVDDILVVAGDNLFEFSLAELNDFYKQKKSSVVALFDIKKKEIAAKKYGIVELDDKFKIIGFEEKPPQPKTTLISTACYIFTKEDIHLLYECIRENKKPDNLGDFINWLRKKKNIYGKIFTEQWFDIGDHDQLKIAEKHWSKI